MRLESTEYSIDLRPNECGLEEVIIISKASLEKWRDHYFKVGKEINDSGKDEDTKRALCMFYYGKEEVLIDLLKHFEEDEE